MTTRNREIGFKPAPDTVYLGQYGSGGDDFLITPSRDHIRFSTSEDGAIANIQENNSADDQVYVHRIDANWGGQSGMQWLPIYDSSDVPGLLDDIRNDLSQRPVPGAMYVKDPDGTMSLLLLSNKKPALKIRKTGKPGSLADKPKRVSPGTYQYQDGNAVRVGDRKTLHRYHGTARPVGTTLERFDTLVHGPLYTAPDPMVAMEYTDADDGGLITVPLPGEEGMAKEAQLYVLTLTPRVILDGGDCPTNDRHILEETANNIGADVIECPDFGEQPETVVLNPNIISIDNVYRVDWDDEKTHADVTKITNNPNTVYDDIIHESLPDQSMVQARWGNRSEITANGIEDKQKQMDVGDLRPTQMEDLRRDIDMYKSAEEFRERQRNLYGRLDHSTKGNAPSKARKSSKRIGRGDTHL